MALQGERLRELRKKRAYSREALAEILDVSPMQIYRWETGENDPKGDFIDRLANILGTTADYLLGREDDPLLRDRLTDLSPDERRLIDSYRTGQLKRLLLSLEKAVLAEMDEQSDIPGSDGTVES
jgi:transcriptional regulator with XRE-family HTH domain